MAIFKLLSLILLSACIACATFSKVPSPAAPVDVRNITVLNDAGKPLLMESLTDRHTATVLVWWQNGCPCVRRYQERIEALQKAYADRNVAVFAVASNSDESMAHIQQTAHERNFTVPFLFDVNGQLVQALGVKTTPTSVLLDHQGKRRFMGWIDNERTQGQPDRIPYLENALTQLLTHTPIASTQAPTYGCRITRSIGQPAPHCPSLP